MPSAGRRSNAEHRDTEQYRPPARTDRRRAGAVSIRSAEAWELALGHHLAATGITVFADRRFHGKLRARVLDVARLVHLEVPPHRLSGAPSDDDPAYQFFLPVEGQARVAQETHSAVVEPGRFAVVDTTAAYDLVFEDMTTLVAVRIPRPVIGIPPILMRQVTGTAVGVDGGLIATIMPLLVRLADELIVYSRHSPARLAYNLTDLLTTVLLEHLATVVPGGSAQGLMLEITAYLDDHLGDPELSAETVASAHYISTRYLRKLFEGQHLKVSEWIRARRLESSRRQLVDPALSDEPISVIAARWGFPDSAHFSRLFKATYGRNPRQFRRDGLGAEPDDDVDEE